MEYVFEYDNVSASERLEQYIVDRLDKLGNKYQFVHRADIFLKKENQENRAGRIAKIQLSLPGPRLFAETNASDFEAAVAETIRDLSKQLEKKKGKWSN